MKFRNITIPPEGRNKYGNYISSTEVQNSVVRVSYNGNNTTGGNNPTPTPEEPRDVYTLLLSRNSIKFDGNKLMEQNYYEDIEILGYVNSMRGDTFIGIIDEIPDEDIYSNNSYYDITGIAEKGMNISVWDNGTKETKLRIACTKDAVDNEIKRGTLIVPCSVYKRSGDVALGEYLTDWAAEKDNCYTLYLSIDWEISALPISNAYTLELTNENASINCDADGNVLSGAYKPTCTAELYYGIDKVTSGVTFGMSLPSVQNVKGVSINTQSGILTFGSDFTFDGTPLEIEIYATISGKTVGRKIMTISKAIAGKDGEGAVTKWLVISHSAIYVDETRNPAVVTPTLITAKAMQQVGDGSPTECSDTIYYGYDVENPSTEYRGNVAVDVSKKYISFGLKHSNGEYYDIETIPIVHSGKNGADGQDGKDGADGQDGQSAYRLDLTNDAATINCDADGNILSGAYKPTCTARLFLGTQKVEGAVYEILEMSETTNITINSSTGVITIGDISFSNTSLEVTVGAKINNVIYGQSIFTLSKAYAGRNGADGKDGKDGADGINGADGVNGQDGTPILWKGSSATHPSNAQNGWAYYNTSDKKSYVYQDGTWYQMTVDGVDGQNGKDGTSIQIAGTLTSESQLPTPPTNPNDCYVIGNDIYVWTGSNWKNCGQFTGQDGTSMIWKGNHASHPSNPQNGWCYYNTVDKKSYTYSDGQWYIMTTDGLDGADGASIVWKGDLATPPANPQTNWCYRDTDNGMVYIYNGSGWELMVVDGSDGIDGANGKDGMSVYITYHDNPNTSTPATPTGNGTSGGWHTNATTAVNWMSQKISESVTTGTWGAPIRLTGFDGTDGINGVDGADGVNGKDGKDGTSMIWKGTYTSHLSNPQNGWCYYNSSDKKSYIYQDGAWYQMTIDGTDGQDGKDGSNGTDGLSIVWKGDLATPPTNPQTNWCYRDTDNAKVYIYNGSAWELMVLDGSDGEDGADGKDGEDGKDGADGLSVFITYHDNAITSTPATPTGSGNSGGWHTNATKAANWMSQKVAESASSGVWGSPIQICGADGQDGKDGTDGTNGTNGTDGQDAVSYWMEFSANEIKVNQNGFPTPNSITVKGWKQVGENTPVEITSTATIKYGYNTITPNTVGTSVSIPNNPTYNYITFAMYVDGSKVDGNETILILTDGKDGSDGEDGADGRQGAALRGPVDYWKQTYSRRWCNGVLTNSSYPEDGQFIDIMIKDNETYICNTSYNGSANDSWSSVSSKWTKVSDNRYDFIATDILIAENASIDFATSKGLYLKNADGDITAGAEGGEEISFWAGSNEPENGVFKVHYDGTMEAKKGRFGSFSIGVLDNLDSSQLVSDVIYHDEDGENVNIQTEIAPHYYSVCAIDKDDSTRSVSIQIAPNDNEHLGLPHGDESTGQIEVRYGDGIMSGATSNADIAFATNGKVKATNFFRGEWGVKEYVPFCPLADFKITFITDTNYFTKSNGQWYWRNNPIGYDAVTYQYVKVINGEWTAVYSSSSTEGVGLGIYSSAHSKQNNRLYIVI